MRVCAEQKARMWEKGIARMVEWQRRRVMSKEPGIVFVRSPERDAAKLERALITDKPGQAGKRPRVASGTLTRPGQAIPFPL